MVNYVISEFKAVEKDKRIIALFLDFKRTFETIEREIIRNKLYMSGIRRTELEWLKSYMKRLNDIESDKCSSTNQLARMQKLQNRAMRIILG